MENKQSIRGRRGLPWHNHDWLRAELQRLGTVRAVAEAHGINLRTLQDYMSRHKIRAPHRPAEFGRPLKDPTRPSRTTLWRRKRAVKAPSEPD